ncbi:hypothetical protein Tsubulata_011346 [Turnera subulata]|uniref:Uncharacterized protein n=1 Tax=Turnera subulata TaxID=218843 RepID=A0A9Q0JC16_9ROSI|nr:hypothetical protein Tsubulata_011346 [Turnera subulata]
MASVKEVSSHLRPLEEQVNSWRRPLYQWEIEDCKKIELELNGICLKDSHVDQWATSSHPVWCTIGYATFWSIWLARNNLVFNNKVPQEDSIFDIIITRATWWFKSKFNSFPYNSNATLVFAECFKNWNPSRRTPSRML